MMGKLPRNKSEEDLVKRLTKRKAQKKNSSVQDSSNGATYGYNCFRTSAAG
jgi:hypothetical protein